MNQKNLFVPKHKTLIIKIEAISQSNDTLGALSDRETKFQRIPFKNQEEKVPAIKGT